MRPGVRLGCGGEGPPGRTPRSSSSRAPWSPTSRAGTNRPSPAGHRRRDGTSWPPGRRCRVGAETAAATPAAPSPPTVPPAPCERCHIGRWRCRHGASRSNSSNSSSERASQPGTCSTQDRSSSACRVSRSKEGRPGCQLWCQTTTPARQPTGRQRSRRVCRPRSAGPCRDVVAVRRPWRWMLDQGQDSAGHEPRGAHRRTAAGQLGDFDDTATGADLDPTPGAGGRDLVGPRGSTCVDDDLDLVTFHTKSNADQGADSPDTCCSEGRSGSTGSGSGAAGSGAAGSGSTGSGAGDSGAGGSAAAGAGSADGVGGGLAAAESTGATCSPAPSTDCAASPVGSAAPSAVGTVGSAARRRPRRRPPRRRRRRSRSAVEVSGSAAASELAASSDAAAGVTGSATVSAGTAVTGSPAGTVVPPRVPGGLGTAAATAGASADGVPGLRVRGRRLAGVRGCCRARWRSSSATAVRAGRASGWDLTHSSVTASTTTAHDRRSAPHSAGPRSPAGTASTASQPMSLARLSWSPRTSRPTSRLPPAAMPASSAAAGSTARSADSSSTDAARGGSRRAGGRPARRVRSSDRGRSVRSPDSGRRPPSRRPGSRRPPSGGPVSPRSVCLASRSSSSLYRRIARFSEMTPRSRNDWRWLMPVDFFFGTGAHLSLMWVIRSHAAARGSGSATTGCLTGCLTVARRGQERRHD